MTGVRAFPVAAALLAAVLLLPAPRASAADGGAAALVEKEFREAIKVVTPATVVCVPPGKRQGPGGGFDASSGVIVTKSGYVLSDADAGAVMAAGKKEYREPVEIRIPDPKRGTYAVYHAKVVKRVPEIDSCLLKVTDGPSAGFAFVTPRTSEDLQVGSFTFAMGTPFGHDEDGMAAPTAGIVCSLVRSPAGDAGGTFSEVYTSAAVNPGVNGGPLVDADGTLVGIISTWGLPDEANPYQYVGKAFPIDRVKAAYKDLPEFSAVFPDPKTLPPKAKESALLERAFAAAAHQAYASVASLDIKRSDPLKIEIADGQGHTHDFPRYRGPVSAVVVSADGWLVSSLYQFANLAPILNPAAPGDVAEDVGKVTEVTAHFADGTSVAAKVVAHDQRVGIVLLKAEMPADHAVTPLPVAPKESAQPGRMVLSVANPFGGATNPDPLLTLGIVSRLHPDDEADPWRGCFQTDAGTMDGTVGGALVDVHGRLLGISTLWNPLMQGRNSGIGYGIPWAAVEAALPRLKEGTSYLCNGYLGIGISSSETEPGKVEKVEPDSAAANGGLQVGDVIVEVDGHPTRTPSQVMGRIRGRAAGEHVSFAVDRGGKRVEVAFEYGVRPKRV